MRHHCALVVSLCGFVGAARADDLLQVLYSPFQSGPGGEFKISSVSGISPGVTGLAADLSFDTFESFCMQADVAITVGDTYHFVINTGVPSQGGFDPLDDRTAYLYTYFRNGTLPGFDYSAAGRTASSASLQEAIWYIEGEVFGVNNAFVAQATAAVGPGGVWEGVGIGGVRVLNLNALDGGDAQDQLTIIPSQGSFALLGAAGFTLLRRRR